MMPAQVQSTANAPHLPRMEVDEFTAIADYAKLTFGLHLPPAKKEMVFARLIKRLRVLKIDSFSRYLSFIQQDDDGTERSEFLSALTTNVTQFFRENHHFDFLRSDVLPNLIAKARAGHCVRLWSAGCSAGQEPYSLAMVILDLCPDAADLDIKILASDIDPRILEIAKQGDYPLDERDAIPSALQKYTQASPNGAVFSIAPAPRQLITFAELNLIDTWPMRRGFDVILCRNVTIYFDAATQSRLWDRFVHQMSDGGHLFIGHSERLSGPAAAVMRSVGVTVYAKQNWPHK